MELCRIEDMLRHFSTVPIEKDEARAPTNVQLIVPTYDEGIKWDEPALLYSSPEELSKEAIEEPGQEEMTYPPPQTLSLSSK